MTDRIQPTTFRKASYDAQHTSCLVSDFLCFIPNISIDPHADVPQLWTVIFQSTVPQLQEIQQKLTP